MVNKDVEVFVTQNISIGLQGVSPSEDSVCVHVALKMLEALEADPKDTGLPATFSSDM